MDVVAGAGALFFLLAMETGASGTLLLRLAIIDGRGPLNSGCASGCGGTAAPVSLPLPPPPLLLLLLMSKLSPAGVVAVVVAGAAPPPLSNGSNPIQFGRAGDPCILVLL